MYQGIGGRLQAVFLHWGRAGFARLDMYMVCSQDIDIRVNFRTRKTSHLTSLFPRENVHLMISDSRCKPLKELWFRAFGDIRPNPF